MGRRQGSGRDRGLGREGGGAGRKGSRVELQGRSTWRGGDRAWVRGGRRPGWGARWEKVAGGEEESGREATSGPGTSPEEETDLGTSAASLVSPLTFRGDLQTLRHQGPQRGGSAMNPSTGGCRHEHELQETGGVSESA